MRFLGSDWPLATPKKCPNSGRVDGDFRSDRARLSRSPVLRTATFAVLRPSFSTESAARSEDHFMNSRAKTSLLIVAFSLSAFALAQQSAGPLPPVPPALASAKTVFLSNTGADHGLFPSPFSGDTNRAYAEFYSAVQSSGPSNSSTILLKPTSSSSPSSSHPTVLPTPTIRTAPPIPARCSGSQSSIAKPTTFCGR